ncbi:multidrug resistance-associated protein 4-like isoform X2 [Dendronephthya gigantea]|uniref:multidrug resistance-associated protein 4-like isoform X2 n=1 Tax=Dendronephthya gigantea TaxID=151771 RepID=UPI00106BBC0B|nr:multidrug resistance-associated protein 4-like isoform X2 [Dendronephthya gigantea]
MEFYAFLVFAALEEIFFIVEIYGTRHFNLVTPVLGIKARGAVVGLIYQKVLKCSKTMISVGEVMELICNDTQRLVMMADRSLPYMIRKLIIAFIYTCWLSMYLGWKVIPGLFVFVLLTALRVLVTDIDVRLRQNASDVAERRLGYLQEFLTSVISTRLNCFEYIHESKIKLTRWEEIKSKAKRWFILSISFTFNMCGQQVATFFTIIILLFTDSSMITFNTVFTMMMLFLGLSNTLLKATPLGIHFTTDIMTALSRIQGFFERCEMTHAAITTNRFNQINVSKRTEDLAERTIDTTNITNATPYISLNNLSSNLPGAEKANCNGTVSLLSNISLEVSSEGLIIITGPVGSGKSSLLASILDEELPITSGFLKRSGSIAYVSDKPWVSSGTIRENILFGSKYNEGWYYETVRACQLEDDFMRLPAHDLSVVGESGATLSGGQRTRIALARAVYAQADIYLLDDPLSSLDAKVAEKILKSVLNGILSEKIVLLVTQKYLSEADYIVKMDKGTIIAQGTVHEITKTPGIDIAGVKDHWHEEIEDEDRPLEKDDDLAHSEILREAGEDHKVGSVSFGVYAKYFLYGASGVTLLLMLFVAGAGQGLTTWIDIQVSSLPIIMEQKEKLHRMLTMYPIYVTAALLITMLEVSFTFLLPIRANYNIHNKMTTCLLRAPTDFFAVNPVGRILNRFSQDINNLDDLLPYNFSYLFQCTILTLTAVCLCIAANVFLTLAFLPIFLICFKASRFFFKPAMDIKRLMSEAGGPLYSHFSNTLEGLRIIRVHKRQQEFTKVLLSHVDNHHKAMFAYYASARWFVLMIDTILHLFMIIIVTSELYSVKDSTTAAVASVAILYSFHSIIYVGEALRSAVEVQAQMTSAERILAYTEIKPERGSEISDEPPEDWPQFGGIEFKNVSLRYYEKGPKALKDLSFEIKGSEKIGIVGRTGAGKSSLVAALMRIAETEGSIIVDNLDIAHFNPRSTRQRISVISQSPVLFNGSLRENLDPTGNHDDSEIWNVLDQMQLGPLVSGLPNKLENVCAGGGSNFSIGQRQLIHLARVLLKRNKIIIFDEAAGKVGKKTAEQIQNVIYSLFKDCTMIIISHRIDTTKRCDKIMVFDQGSIVEFDKQDVLLDRKNGFFAELVRIGGAREKKDN